MKVRIGDIFEIPLEEGLCSYCRVLGNAQMAFYSFRGNCGAPLIACEQITAAGIIFVISVMKDAPRIGGWRFVRNCALEDDLKVPRHYFIRDAINGSFSIYRSDDGSTRPASREECLELEPAAVWSANHIKDRLIDHFAGRPNRWIESLRQGLMHS